MSWREEIDIVLQDWIAALGGGQGGQRILIRGGPQPRAIRDHITSLYAARLLLRL